MSLEERNGKTDLKDTMDLIRRFEGLIEMGILGIVFYLVWRAMYRGTYGFPAFYGRGKVVLIGVYMIVQYLVFHMNESFGFGKLKFSGLVISQVVSVVCGNVIVFLFFLLWPMCW